jgi:hypothetical protein
MTLKTILERKPLRTFLKEREPLIPHKKLIDILGIDPNSTFTQIVDKVRREDAIEVIASSTWARSLAEGVCGPGYVGLTPGTPEYERCVYTVSHRVAEKVAPTALPTPVAPPPRPRKR